MFLIFLVLRCVRHMHSVACCWQCFFVQRLDTFFKINITFLTVFIPCSNKQLTRTRTWQKTAITTVTVTSPSSQSLTNITPRGLLLQRTSDCRWRRWSWRLTAVKDTSMIWNMATLMFMTRFFYLLIISTTIINMSLLFFKFVSGHFDSDVCLCMSCL